MSPAAAALKSVLQYEVTCSVADAIDRALAVIAGDDAHERLESGVDELVEYGHAVLLDGWLRINDDAADIAAWERMVC